MNKGLKISFVISVIVLALLALVRDELIKRMVVSLAKDVAGVDVAIGDFKLGLVSQSVQIKDLKVYNPPGFPSKDVMLDVPEVFVKIDVPAFFSGTLHLVHMRFNLKEARVIRRKDGALNVGALKFASAKPAAGSSQTPAGKPAAAKEMKMQLDLLSLNIGSIYIEDYTSGKDKPKVTVANLNMREREFKNVTSVGELVSLVMFQALLPTGLNGNLFSATQGVIDAPLFGAIDGLLKHR